MAETTDDVNKKMFFTLYISAQLINLQNLCKYDGYEIKVECIGCKEMGWAKVRKSGTLRISTLDFFSYVHMFRRCRNCRRIQEITMVDDSKLIYEKDNCGEYQPFANFQCVGCQPKVLKPRTEFNSRSDVSHERFRFTLINGEWTGFDKTAEKAVEVYDFQSAFVEYDENDAQVN